MKKAPRNITLINQSLDAARELLSCLQEEYQVTELRELDSLKNHLRVQAPELAICGIGSLKASELLSIRRSLQEPGASLILTGPEEAFGIQTEMLEPDEYHIILEPFRKLDILRTVYLAMYWRRGKRILKDMLTAEQDRKDLLATIDHELRKPLNGLLGMLELLSKRDYDEDTEIYVHLAKHSARQLEALTQDILSFSQTADNTMQFNYTSILAGDLLKSICRLYENPARQKGLQLKLDAPPEELRFYGDGVRINQIASNLLSNAVKFSDSGTIRVEYRFEDHQFRLTVGDQGRGIAPARLESLFSPPGDKHANYTKAGVGLGLGLRICRNLAKGMNGRMNIHSVEGEGTKVTVIIPEHPLNADPPEPSPKNDALRSGSPEERKTVLIVEDDTTSMYYLEQLLQRRGLNVLQAMDGREALEEISQDCPSLILLDIGLPKINGLEFTKRLKANPEYRDIPIIAVTAYTMKKDVENIQKAGIDAIISKPVNEDELTEKLNLYLNT